MKQLIVLGRAGRLAIHLLSQRVGRRRHIRFGRIFAQKAFHHLDRPQELAAIVEKAGNLGLPLEGSLDGRPIDEKTPLVLAQGAVSQRHAQNGIEIDLHVGEFFFDDLEVLDD